jgi:hypothetical protein
MMAMAKPKANPPAAGPGTDPVHEYLATIGRKGGEAKVRKGIGTLSPAARKALAAKALKARREKKRKAKKAGV